MGIIFITGIDTGIGKTYVTGLLGRALQEQGMRVITSKIVQTGARGIFRLDDVPVPDARPPLLEVAAPNHVGLTFRPDLEGAWDDLYLRMRPR